MARYVKSLVVSLIAALLFLVSCETEKSLPILKMTDLNVDMFALNIERPHQIRKHIFHDANTDEIFFFSYDPDRHFITRHTFSNGDIDTIILPNHSFSPYGIMSLHVHRLDSIFVVPDYYGVKNIVFLYDDKGTEISRRELLPELFSDSVSFIIHSSGDYLPKFEFPYFIINLGFQNFRIDASRRIVKGDFKSVTTSPNMVAIDFADSMLLPFLIPNTFANPYDRICKPQTAGTGLDLFFAYDGTPIVYRYQYKNREWLMEDQVNLGEVIDFQHFVDKDFKDYSQVSIENDNINNLLYDPQREFLYVFIRKAIPYVDESSMEVASYFDKPVTMLVFNNKLQFLGCVEDWGILDETWAHINGRICGDHLVLPNYKKGDRSDSTTYFLLDLNDLEEKLLK